MRKRTTCKRGSPLLAIVGGLAFAAPIAAKTPVIMEVVAECQLIDGQNHTVRVAMNHSYSGMGNYQYSFRNSATNQTTNFWGPYGHTQATMTAPLPPGIYDLTVAVTNIGTTVPIPGRPKAVLTGIKVTQAFSTGGKGSGCRF